ncbi:hypothetical protein [Stakelama pacifica]|uniref:hypothetical protein n=1 Tax=Stakelama pacifica TaxID=517720 RepID=UPI00105E62F1|nr:hypothetical protein [Stakelama pacifica]
MSILTIAPAAGGTGFVVSEMMGRSKIYYGKSDNSCDYLRLSAIICDYLRLSAIICDYLRLSAIICENVRLNSK